MYAYGGFLEHVFLFSGRGLMKKLNTDTRLQLKNDTQHRGRGPPEGHQINSGGPMINRRGKKKNVHLTQVITIIKLILLLLKFWHPFIHSEF